MSKARQLRDVELDRLAMLYLEAKARRAHRAIRNLFALADRGHEDLEDMLYELAERWDREPAAT